MSDVTTPLTWEIGITGHQSLQARLQAARVDRSEVASWRWVKARFRERLAQLESRSVVVLCSLAIGADQELASVALRHHARLRIVIPSLHYIDTFADNLHRRHYRTLLSHAESVATLQFGAPTEEAFYAAGKRIVDECNELVAVWDGAPSGGLGGTADVVAYAISKNRPVTHVNPITLTVTRR